jgi:DNA (cytosine-5)-methyltransferase 1
VAHADSEQRDEGLQSVSGGFSERVGGDSVSDHGVDHTLSLGRDAGRQWDHGQDVGEQFDSDVEDGGADKTNGFWGDVDWLGCRDGKWRPVRSGTFPLVNGATSRVGRLRAYGNAITAQVAQGLIESYMETADA